MPVRRQCAPHHRDEGQDVKALGNADRAEPGFYELPRQGPGRQALRKAPDDARQGHAAAAAEARFPVIEKAGFPASHGGGQGAVVGNLPLVGNGDGFCLRCQLGQHGTAGQRYVVCIGKGGENRRSQRFCCLQIGLQQRCQARIGQNKQHTAAGFQQTADLGGLVDVGSGEVKPRVAGIPQIGGVDPHLPEEGAAQAAGIEPDVLQGGVLPVRIGCKALVQPLRIGPCLGVRDEPLFLHPPDPGVPAGDAAGRQRTADFPIGIVSGQNVTAEIAAQPALLLQNLHMSLRS